MACPICSAEGEHKHYKCPGCEAGCADCGTDSPTETAACHCGTNLEEVCEGCQNPVSKCSCG